MMLDLSRIAVVIIGRNEGERLVRCLASVPADVGQIIYVDSGSTDDSVANATEAGATIVALDTDKPFTAARARNAGSDALPDGLQIDFIQFVDGDCEIQPDWLMTALTFLNEVPKAAAVCGRRRERFPDATIYNRMCDEEWDTPIGPALACGGDAMMRHTAFDAVGGFNPLLIAGEEPELCVRLRQSGWEVHRLDAEMTLHDAAMTHFSQFWKRARRAGHASAEGAAIHGGLPERHGVAQTRRAVFWGLGLPIMALLGALITPLALLFLLAYPAQILRLTARRKFQNAFAWQDAFFLTIGKFPEALGVVEYWWRRLTSRQMTLIEYK